MPPLAYSELFHSSPIVVHSIIESIDKIRRHTNSEMHLLNFQINAILVLTSYLKAAKYELQSERVHITNHLQRQVYFFACFLFAKEKKMLTTPRVYS